MREGVFKRFEYLSLPFSITGNHEKFRELLKKAQENGTSFSYELSNDPNAQEIVKNVLGKMESSPSFSKQVVDTLLPILYVDDNIINDVNLGENLEDNIAKVVVGWKHQADFYCIEGLVGGDGEVNPFRQQGNSAFIAGGLDSLETVLPTLKTHLSNDEWLKTCLKLSSIIERDYSQIDRAVDELNLRNKNKICSDEELENSLQLLDELTNIRLDTNSEVGKFYNALIRFHGAIPIALKKNGVEGNTYNSISGPAKKALKLIQDNPDIVKNLSSITDASSPKGLALASLIDNEVIGDKSLLKGKVEDLEDILASKVPEERRNFSTFDLDDPCFYKSMVGGKWKGLKLLHNTKEALGLNYKVPKGYVISSLEISRKLSENGVLDIINQNIFSLDDNRRNAIRERIDNTIFDSNHQGKELGNSLIMRSSMYGEDGSSNFSGTYESFPCKIEDRPNAIRNVVRSYFSDEAIKSREDVGLAHIPGICVINQEKIEGIGGVIHLTKNQSSFSIAETPEDAVLGSGDYQTSEDITKLVEGTPLHKVGKDLQTLYQIFGDENFAKLVS